MAGGDAATVRESDRVQHGLAAAASTGGQQVALPVVAAISRSSASWLGVSTPSAITSRSRLCPRPTMVRTISVLCG